MMPPMAFPWLLSLLFLEPNFLASTLWASLYLAQRSQRQEHMKPEKSIQKPNGYQYFQPILRIKITYGVVLENTQMDDPRPSPKANQTSPPLSLCQHSRQIRYMGRGAKTRKGVEEC